MARILVVDDQAVYRTGLRGLICTQMLGAEVLEASSLPQALPEIQNGAFDLVLIGLDLSDAKTVDALKSAAREASPATRIAIISASDTRADILASLAAGLHGFISKHSPTPLFWTPLPDFCPGGFMCLVRLQKQMMAKRPLAEATTSAIFFRPRPTS